MSDNQTPKLLPCPFCGGEAMLGQDPTHGSWAVQCLGCDAEYISHQDPADVVAAGWNRRADLVPQVDVEGLRWALVSAVISRLGEHMSNDSEPLADDFRRILNAALGRDER